MIVLFHALLYAINEWGKPHTPIWLNDVRLITSQAVEAMLEAETD